MCGIFGVVLGSDSAYGQAFARKSLTQLALMAEARGQDSSGLAFRDPAKKRIEIFKGDISIEELLGDKRVRQKIESLSGAYHANTDQPFVVMGHSRLVTNGSQTRNENNQPVVKNGIVAIHNGIITNDGALWERHPELQRQYDIDTEVMLALIRKHIEDGWGVATAINKTVTEVFGTVATALLFEDHPALALTSNNGSLYILTNETDLLVFASEDHFLQVFATRMSLDEANGFRLRQVSPGTGYVLDMESFDLREFGYSDEPLRAAGDVMGGDSHDIEVESVARPHAQGELIMDPWEIAWKPEAAKEEALLEYNVEDIRTLRRCSRCILPETFPFIEFDEHGVCNYCRNYKIRNNPKPIDELFELVAPYRRSDGQPDCLVPYSGGRDSTFTLHVVKRVLGLNPIAFTYDWGMVNDLARRNTARVCGKLGVEHIFRAADLWWKRENVRKNILAWLRKPHLGMVPLFMAGDKYFYYYTHQIKRQTGIRLNIWGVNPLENTEFKVGFLGVPPDHDKKWIYSLSAQRQARLFANMGRIVASNPRYLNRSLWNSAGGFLWRSVLPKRDYAHLFDYYCWNESEVEEVLEEYEWERAVDTRFSWRIGDATAPFYNYIYCTVAGFSEHDTFRSNQIREGMLTREEALRLVEEENQPRYPSLKWYTSIVGLDYRTTIATINRIPKLYGNGGQARRRVEEGE